MWKIDPENSPRYSEFLYLCENHCASGMQMKAVSGDEKGELNKQVQAEVKTLKGLKEATASAQEKCVQSSSLKEPLPMHALLMCLRSQPLQTLQHPVSHTQANLVVLNY